MGEARYRSGEAVKRLLNCVFTESICQLRCHYCYVGQTQAHVKRSTPNPHSVAEMRSALSYERLGGRCHMNICAVGETLLVPEVLELARAFIEEGHLVTLVTNALAKREIEEICTWEQVYKDNTFIKVSYHYLQLHEKGLEKIFWQNVHLLEAAGISYTVELTLNHESVPLIDKVLQECNEELGVPCHVIESRLQDGANWPRLTKLSVSEHQSAWGRFHSPLFEFQQSIWGQERREFCYAGDWIASINMKTGELVPCFGGGHLLDNIYEHLDRPINFQAIGHACPWGHCYAGYVLLSFGAIPELDTPTYASLRDRESMIGKNWLQVPIRSSFSSKLHRMNQSYSLSRQIWTNFVMDSIYRRTSAPPRETEEGAQAMVEPQSSDVVKLARHYLAHHNYHLVAVYGAGVLGQAAGRVFSEAGAEVVCFLDRQYEQLRNISPCCLSPETAVQGADMILVTPYWEFENIKSYLRQHNDLPIVSVLDIWKS